MQLQVCNRRDNRISVRTLRERESLSEHRISVARFMQRVQALRLFLRTAAQIPDLCCQNCTRVLAIPVTASRRQTGGYLALRNVPSQVDVIISVIMYTTLKKKESIIRLNDHNVRNGGDVGMQKKNGEKVRSP